MASRGYLCNDGSFLSSSCCLQGPDLILDIPSLVSITNHNQVRIGGDDGVLLPLDERADVESQNHRSENSGPHAVFLFCPGVRVAGAGAHGHTSVTVVVE